MTREYLKKATITAESAASDVTEIVQGILSDIEAGGDAKALEYAAKFLSRRRSRMTSTSAQPM
jgi:sulfopropanediol 3-dehydrogenase